MEFVWPAYTNEALDGTRSWSATFKGFDQRLDEFHYEIVITELGRETARFKVSGGLPMTREGNRRL